jgi:hypothetical protein
MRELILVLSGSLFIVILAYELDHFQPHYCLTTHNLIPGRPSKAREWISVLLLLVYVVALSGFLATS